MTDTALPAGVQAVLMPEAGNTMEEGTIIAWRVQPGDHIEPGQIIAEIETDKATMELEAEVGGRVAKLLIGPGDSMPVKQPIAYLADDDGLLAGLGGGSETAPAVAEAPTAPAATEIPSVTLPGSANGSNGAHNPFPAPIPTDPGSRISVDDLPAGVRASPAARKLARDLGVPIPANLASKGSGPGGRVMTRDIERLAAQGATAPAATPAPARPTAQAPAMPASASPQMSEGARRLPLSKMRRAIGANLQRSTQTVPHFYSKLTIDAGPLMTLRASLKPVVGCSVNDLIVLACAKAIMEFPAFRQQLDEQAGEMVEHAHAHIGVAVGLDEGEGLVVPVLMNADTMGLGQIARSARELVDNARNGKLENAGKGVFTISNLGMFGVEEFTAIINPPEAAILAVSAVREDVVVHDGAIRPGKRMTMTLSADHRVIDGLMAARFLARLKEMLEDPGALV